MLSMSVNLKVHDQPNVTPIITSRRRFKLKNDVFYSWENKQIKIWSGYTFDGASVPRIFFWFISPMNPRVIAGALLHDALYDKPDLRGIGTYYVDEDPVHRRFSKNEADILFRLANRSNKLNKVRSFVSYLAVRIFGRGNF